MRNWRGEMTGECIYCGGGAGAHQDTCPHAQCTRLYARVRELEAENISLRDINKNLADYDEAYHEAEAERDRLRMQVKAAEDVIGKAASVITADTDAGLDALCAIQSWQITPTEMYYRNEAEARAAKEGQ